MAEFFNKWKQALNRSSKAAFGRLATVFGATEIDSSTWEELEARLIQAHLGMATTREHAAAVQRAAGSHPQQPDGRIEKSSSGERKSPGRCAACCLAGVGCHNRAKCPAASTHVQRSSQGDRCYHRQARLFRARRHGVCYSKRIRYSHPLCRIGRKIGRLGKI